MITYRGITWGEVLPIWRDQLWVGRQSPIEPCSAMTFMGHGTEYSHEPSYMDELPFFIGAFDDNHLVGVNSGHPTGTSFRSRGIWVDPDYRGSGIAKSLYTRTIRHARNRRFSHIWALPRGGASLALHERLGFIKCSDFFDQDMEFGPNCYVSLTL